MKQVLVPIELDRTRYLLYNMSALYDMEQEHDTIPNAIASLRQNPIGSLPCLLGFGLAHEESLSPDYIELFINVDNRIQITEKVVHAISIAFPSSKDNAATTSSEEGGWDWAWTYYIGTVLLGMSESAFWRCTPKKLFALWDMHKQYNGLDQREQQPATVPSNYIDQFI